MFILFNFKNSIGNLNEIMYRKLFDQGNNLYKVYNTVLNMMPLGAISS